MAEVEWNKLREWGGERLLHDFCQLSNRYGQRPKLQGCSLSTLSFENESVERPILQRVVVGVSSCFSAGRDGGSDRAPESKLKGTGGLASTDFQIRTTVNLRGRVRHDAALRILVRLDDPYQRVGEG